MQTSKPSEYDANQGITKSAICAARIDGDDGISMMHMRAAMLKSRTEEGQTASMRWGTLAHAALLEPTVLASRCAVFEGRKAGNSWADFRATHADKWIVTPDELEKLAAMGAALRADRQARSIIGRVEQTEVPIVWDDVNYGAAKGRPDATGKGFVLEYKTTKMASKSAFLRDCGKRGYDLGLAWYWHGLGRPDTVRMLAQQSVEPFMPMCFAVSFTVLETAYKRAAKIATQYRICERIGVFASPYDSLMTFEIPTYGALEVDVSEGEMEGSEL